MLMHVILYGDIQSFGALHLIAYYYSGCAVLIILMEEEEEMF